MSGSTFSNHRATFLGLPSEIRLQVYEILVTDPRTKIEGYLVLCTEQQLSSQILRTCRQVYQEASPVLYGRNTFGYMLEEIHIARYLVNDVSIAKISKLIIDVGRFQGGGLSDACIGLESAANSGMFSGLRVLEVIFCLDDPTICVAPIYLVEIFSVLRRLIEDPNLPQLDRMSTEIGRYCRLASSHEPLFPGETVVHESHNVHDSMPDFLVILRGISERLYEEVM